MSRIHLSDDRLIEICLSESIDEINEPHLQSCERCEARRAALATTLSDVSIRVAAEADEHFPAERLARQQARILQQLDHLGRPARVIAFPAGYTKESRPVARRVPSWFAAAGAVAAAFVVGILVDRVAHLAPSSVRPDVRLVSRASDSSAPIRTVVASLSDDELLGQIEVAVGSAGPAALRPLDALTPRAWDVR